MTKIDIYSGFLGAGKTTLIKKMISLIIVGLKMDLLIIMIARLILLQVLLIQFMT